MDSSFCFSHSSFSSILHNKEMKVYLPLVVFGLLLLGILDGHFELGSLHVVVVHENLLLMAHVCIHLFRDDLRL
jgi:hypothetical protein